MKKELLSIRSMSESDLPLVVDLCRQLGYETNLPDLRKRYSRLIAHPEHGLFVACAEEIRPVGWMHLREMYSLERNFVIEVAAIVVDEQCRGRGIGRKLMETAEEWGAERGFPSVILRSRETRLDAHRFYEGLGYLKAKKSYGFIKELDRRTVGNEV